MSRASAARVSADIDQRAAFTSSCGG